MKPPYYLDYALHHLAIRRYERPATNKPAVLPVLVALAIPVVLLVWSTL